MSYLRIKRRFRDSLVLPPTGDDLPSVNQIRFIVRPVMEADSNCAWGKSLAGRSNSAVPDGLNERNVTAPATQAALDRPPRLETVAARSVAYILGSKARRC